MCAGAGAGGTVHGMWNDGAAGCDVTLGPLGLFDIDAPASLSPGASRRACTNAARDANVAHGSAPKIAGAPFASTRRNLQRARVVPPACRPRGADEVRERDVQGIERVDRAEVDVLSHGRAAARPRGRRHELDVALHRPRRAPGAFAADAFAAGAAAAGEVGNAGATPASESMEMGALDAVGRCVAPAWPGPGNPENAVAPGNPPSAPNALDTP